MFVLFVLQGHDEEAVLDQGKTSSTLYTNFEKEELESESWSVYMHTYCSEVASVWIYCQTEKSRPVFMR